MGMKFNKEIRILLIGCGEIGALLDIQSDEIQTHLKALITLGMKNISVFDLSQDFIDQVRSKYPIHVVHEIKYHHFDLVIIATPTATHTKYLVEAMNQNVPLIICEKPVSNDKNDLDKLLSLSQISKSKVYVNYIRQFIPSYSQLRNWIHSQSVQQNKLNKISVHYTRGMLNNGGHALGLIQFLGENFQISDLCIHTIEYELMNDPTVTCTFKISPNIFCSFTGLGDSAYAFFEISLYFQKSVVKITESGNDIDYYEISESKESKYKRPLKKNEILSERGLLKNYMLHLYNHVLADGQDNLRESIFTNQILLNIVSACQN